MKLIILYGNANREKRIDLAKELMRYKNDLLVLMPEYTVIKGISYYEMEKGLMDISSSSIIFVESLATCFELSMLMTRDHYKVIYSAKQENYVLERSGFIEDTIIKEIPEKNLINISQNRIEIVYSNNIIPYVDKKYLTAQILEKCRFDELIDKEVNSFYSKNVELNKKLRLFNFMNKFIEVLLENNFIEIDYDEIREMIYELMFSKLTEYKFNLLMDNIFILIWKESKDLKEKKEIIKTLSIELYDKYNLCRKYIGEEHV